MSSSSSAAAATSIKPKSLAPMFGGAAKPPAKAAATQVTAMSDATSSSSSSAAAASDVKADAKATLPWIEKYRPSQLDDLISHTEIITTIKRLLDKGELPHLLLYGPPGTGKTSTILAIARQLNGPHFNSMVLELNASDDRGIDVVREQIKDFASSRKLFSTGVKLVILDEADSMTSAAQMALRRVIEQYTKSTRFTLIANYIHKLIPALQSRCTRFRFGPLKEEHIQTRLTEIVTKEQVLIDSAAKSAIIRLSGGDMRKVLNILQASYMAFGRDSETNQRQQLTEQHVYTCTGNPLPADITIALNSLMNDSFKVAFDTIHNLQIEKGYSLVDIVARLHEQVLKVSFPPAALTLLLDQLSNVEYRLAFGTSEKLQLGALVGAFQLTKDKIFQISHAVDAAESKSASAIATSASSSSSAASAAAAAVAKPVASSAAAAAPVAAASAKNMLHK